MNAADWTTIAPGPHDIRLVVADMDGTLLDGESRIPEGFWERLDRMEQLGVRFVPASGRQYATLTSMFGTAMPDGSYIAENGNLVVADGEIASVSGIEHGAVSRIIDVVMANGQTSHAVSDAADASDSADAAADSSHAPAFDIGLVLCAAEGAYVTRHDPDFLAECRKYYAKLTVVDDLHSITEDILKAAIFDFGPSQPMADALLSGFTKELQVVVSGAHWVDIMNLGTDKRRGVVALQEHFGITPAQTAVFGDYLNDLEMLDAGEWSFAMSNAHPDLKEAAHYIAPANTEYGVLQVLDRLLG
ncbi:MAG: Cof-type HAD-IIB family hydrolase [Bifidobacterium tibiigranuli]|jgi:HAD superfamily hydrolase (TIGR01484 family)|uniref:Cof-type HAD-IIB family hydrolase n=1 Tax=Bifidobacterium tibiigranuli TaxID=2172043 RepID=UPI0026EDB974|nr:Cof-type HAD-IIB family hydrolase [Bifidobacterium tibiigranuli]MCI1673609.1 Cof-type HAD-IIB family hydrolase [Bifidobacterium tibiigranuli]MCI1713796.1 Cof-type HAD-IIB family hydrolase [Bifidobacterium tibiigranuli]MCI1834602.1 Cof-type HAD-IIB family hydrolase [Bifidobacterium tibiigranuli]